MEAQFKKMGRPCPGGGEWDDETLSWLAERAGCSLEVFRAAALDAWTRMALRFLETGDAGAAEPVRPLSGADLDLSDARARARAVLDRTDVYGSDLDEFEGNAIVAFAHDHYLDAHPEAKKRLENMLREAVEEADRPGSRSYGGELVHAWMQHRLDGTLVDIKTFAAANGMSHLILERQEDGSLAPVASVAQDDACED